MIGARAKATVSIKINRIYKKEYDRWFTTGQLKRYEFFRRLLKWLVFTRT